MLHITPDIAIADEELEERFVLSGGPGGQNVNKLATAVELRFDAARSPALPPTVLPRLRRLAGRRMTAAGVIVIQARRHRTQEANRKDARERLASLIRRAVMTPKPRRPTRPSKAAMERRLRTKKQRGQTKQTRRRPGSEE